MTLKKTGILFLLSIFFLYFLCPVLCPALRVENCSLSDDGQIAIYRLAEISLKTETNQVGSMCCHAGDRAPAPPDKNTDDENCCLDRLMLLGASEFLPFSQTLNENCSFIAVTPSLPTSPQVGASCAVDLQRLHSSYPDVLPHQISPRAPPFFLA